MIYLLDLNYTLVSNSEQKLAPFTRQIEGETYRTELLQRLQGETVILITARPHIYREQTLASIQAKTGWAPTAAFFNEYNLRPHLAKGRLLKEKILPVWSGPFFGVESNPLTRAMYAKHGIDAQTWSEFLTVKDPV
jgi:hypothetical protein